MPIHCSHPSTGELYGRDSKNSCSTKTRCHSLATPQCFQRDGCKLRLLDGPLNPPDPEDRLRRVEAPPRENTSFLFTDLFSIPARVYVNSKCEPFNTVINVKVIQEISGANTEHRKPKQYTHKAMEKKRGNI